MCESLVGAENAITRQSAIATSSLLPGPAGPAGSSITRSGGGVINTAEVIVAFGILRDVRLSHDCCAATLVGRSASPASKVTYTNDPKRYLMQISPCASCCI